MKADCGISTLPNWCSYRTFQKSFSRRLETQQKQVAALRIADLCHVVVSGDDITDPNLPRGTKKTPEIEFGGFAAILRVDPDDAAGIAFDGREQHFPATRRVRNRCQAAQAPFRSGSGGDWCRRGAKAARVRRYARRSDVRPRRRGRRCGSVPPMKRPALSLDPAAKLS
jgi:hypothetical protein